MTFIRLLSAFMPIYQAVKFTHSSSLAAGLARVSQFGLLMLSMSVTGYSMAGDNHDHKHNHDHHHHDHGSDNTSLAVHQHGKASLQLVMEAETVRVDLLSPAYNIIGFEHAIETAKQQSQLDAAIALLEQPADWLTLEAGDCQLADVEVTHTFAAEQNKHADFKASYEYNCAALGQIEAVNIQLAQRLPELVLLEVMWITPAKQGAATLTGGETQLTF